MLKVSFMKMFSASNSVNIFRVNVNRSQYTNLPNRLPG